MTEGKTAAGWAEDIYALIIGDMAAPFPWGKQIPPDVTSFSELHDYCDANCYLIDTLGDLVCVFTDDAAGRAATGLANAVTSEVSRLLEQRLEERMTGHGAA